MNKRKYAETAGRGPRNGRKGFLPFSQGRLRRWAFLLPAAAISLSLTACGLFDRQEQAPLIVQDGDLPRIVMLPLQNLGAAEDAFIAKGMTQAVSKRLGAIHRLSVISGSTDAEAGNGRKTPREIGEELAVDYVLNGDFFRTNDGESPQRLRIKIQLIEIGREIPVWSESFDRPLSDIIAIQNEMANAVVSAIGVVPTAAELTALDFRPTTNLDAYFEYLHGLTYSWSFELAELELAEEHFTAAIDLDPVFAAAHASLSETHSLIFHFRYDRSPQRLARAIAAARRALEIDPRLPEAHRALGYYYYWGQKNYEYALGNFAAAAEGRPNDPLIVSSIGVVLRRQGRWEEALEALQLAAEIDPKSDVGAIDLASTCGRMRRYAEAVDHCRRAIELDPGDTYPYVFYARILRSWNGSVAAAREILDSMPAGESAQQAVYFYEQALFERDFEGALRHLELSDHLISEPIDETIFPRSLAECEVAVLQGREAEDESTCREALDYLERAREDSPVDPAISSALGWTYALFGRKDEAIEAGQRAYELLPIESDAMAGHSYLIRMAKIFAWVDEPYKAVKTIEKALAFPGWISLATLQLDPEWDPIRNDPRFQELLRIHGTSD